MRRRANISVLRGVHVLLVCDDAQRRSLFAHALKYAAALVTTSASAADARGVMERVRPNVIVVELRAADDAARFIGTVRGLASEGGGKIPALVSKARAACSGIRATAGLDKKRLGLGSDKETPWD